MTAVDNRCAAVPYPREAEHEQRAVFDQPGPANVQAGIEVVQDAERADLIGDKALAELENASESMKTVMATNGRHVSDRLAAEQRWRRDQADTDDAVRTTVSGTAARHAAHARAALERARMTDPTQPGLWVGQANLSATGRRVWLEHCARSWGVAPTALAADLDDAELDAARDHGWGIDADDLHYRSPDLDDFDDVMEDGHAR